MWYWSVSLIVEDFWHELITGVAIDAVLNKYLIVKLKRLF